MSSAKELEAKIISDTKNINLVTKVINGIKSSNTPTELRTWYQALSRVFGHLATKSLISSEPADSAEDYVKRLVSGAAEPPPKKQQRKSPKSGVSAALDQAREWCRNKWAESIYSLLVIAADVHENAGEVSYSLDMRVASLNGFMEFVPLATVP